MAAAGDQELRLLVTGGSGVGKSTLVNGILGEDVYVATEGGSFEGGTQTVAEYKTTIHGVPVVVFDTPGLQEVTKDEVSVIEEIKKKCQNPTLVLYCMKMAESRLCSQEEYKCAIVKITAKFGEDFWEHAVLVLTFANKEDVTRRDERDEDKGPEPRWDDEVSWKELLKKRFEGRVKKWKEGFHKFLIEEVGLRKDIAERIPVVPVGDQKKTKGNHDPYHLPNCDDWLDELWKACSLQDKENSLLDKIKEHRMLVKDARMKNKTGRHLEEETKKRERQAEEKCRKGAQSRTPEMNDLVRLFRSSAVHFKLIGIGLDVEVGDLLPYPAATNHNLITVFKRWIDSNNDVTWMKILQVCEDYPQDLGKAKAEVKRFLDCVN